MLIVLKYGGNALRGRGAPDPLLDEVAQRVAGGDRVVLVHGGGPQIDAALADGPAERKDGLRVTGAAALEIVERVLCGTVNKALVRALQRRGVAAVGLSGQDGPLLVASSATASDGSSLGYVGRIEAVHPRVLDGMLGAGFTPVVAPLGVASDGSSALNINADSAAGAIAGSMGADAYVVITSVERVRRNPADPATGIARLTAAEARALLAAGAFADGMQPKIESVLDALERGAARAVICGSGPGALARGLAGDGTAVVRA
jgi:acetylglutamate kinase